MPDLLQGFLADTWWYALTARLPDAELKKLAELRRTQGFNAVQLVFGIPPESTPEDPNSYSPYGPAWTRKGSFNQAYIRFARQRIQILNACGFTVVVYGAWGNQMGWLGIQRMMDWWAEIINATDDLEVIYCLTGESNLHPGPEDERLFDHYPSNLNGAATLVSQPTLFNRILARQDLKSLRLQSRRRAWSILLDFVSRQTRKPIIIHPLPDETGFDAVENPRRLSANSGQSGHHTAYRSRLLDLPLQHLANEDPAGRGFINLEPWYEGILDRFGAEDQLYAYWVSMLAGSISYCYGAHGIWNVGDGDFLNHWGRQTFQQAFTLDTPRLIGLSHQVFRKHSRSPKEINPVIRQGKLISLNQVTETHSITFFPDIQLADAHPAGEIWLPLQGCWASELPASGPVVLFS